jgi:predicted amidohydrolase
MKAGFLQFRPEFGKPDINIQRIEKFLVDKEFDLIVLPELSNSGYLFTDEKELAEFSEAIPGKFSEKLIEISHAKNAYIVCGICEKEDKKYYNSSVLFKPDGTFEVYRKIHLFFEEKFWFEKGNNPFCVYELKDKKGNSFRLGMMICFDWIFPESARTLALKGAQIICHPSNLVLPYCQDAMVTRAIENKIFIITTNRIGTEVKGEKSLTFTGLSEVVTPKAKIEYRAPSDTEEVFLIEINPAEADNKFVNEFNNVLAERRPDFYFD